MSSITHTAAEITVEYVDPAGVAQTLVFNRFTDADKHDLNAIPGLLDKTADLLVNVSARTWGDVTDINLGAFASEDSGNLGPSHASGLTYYTSRVPTASEARNDYVYIRIPENRDARGLSD